MQDSLFLAGSAIAVTADQFNPNARFANITVQDAVGSALLLQYHPNAFECSVYSMLKWSGEYPPKTSMVRGVKVARCSPMIDAIVNVKEACNVALLEMEAESSVRA